MSLIPKFIMIYSPKFFIPEKLKKFLIHNVQAYGLVNENIYGR